MEGCHRDVSETRQLVEHRAERVCLHSSAILRSEWEQLQHERQSEDDSRSA
jgi:hypothetical protein